MKNNKRQQRDRSEDPVFGRASLMMTAGVLIAVVAGVPTAYGAEKENVTWLVQWEANSAPQPPQWLPVGGIASEARLVDEALHVKDESADDMGCFRAAWKASPTCETIVEARVRVVSVKAFKGGTSVWPWQEGAPIGLLVSDGRYQQGLILCPGRIGTFLDRRAVTDTTSGFRVYRLVIRGNDMSVYVDGELKIRGRGAFSKPADTPQPFVQFGSSSGPWMGESYWSYVRVGVRETPAAFEKEELKIAISKPWEIPSPRGMRQTRPYLYNVGEGVLLMSVAQGPDKYYEPYGVLRSLDEGKTWAPIEDLQLKTFAPLPMIRLTDGDILGVSRWNVKYDDGVYVGMSYRFDRRADHFTMFENRIQAPKDAGSILVFDRHLFRIEGDVLLAVCYSNSRRAYLLKTADEGKSWKHFSTIGVGHEPAVVRLSETEMMALLRLGSMRPFEQTWSRDGGKTWTAPTSLEEGSVDADLAHMSNGVLACSYGRPGSCVMFSTDQGRSWKQHRVISRERGFNYTSLCEVRPGRLLYVHDAPRLQAVHIDVEPVERRGL